MNSTTRVVHDLHAGFHTALGRRLKVCASAPATMLRETGCIQRAGTSTLDNGLEAEFYGLPEKPITCSWEDASCFRLKHAYAVGDQSQVFLKDGSFFLPCIHPQQNFLKGMNIRRPVKSRAKKIKGHVFHLTGRNHKNRGHFLLHHLPRILAARALLERPDGPSVFISRQDAPDKRLENEPAIVAIAREILGDVEVIELQKFSQKEQIAKYQQAPMILELIGQGLCNVVFANGKLFVALKPGLTVDDYIAPGHTTHTALVCGNHAINLFQRILARPGQLELRRRTFPAAVDRFVEIPAACRDRQPIEIYTAKLRSRV